MVKEKRYVICTKDLESTTQAIFVSQLKLLS